MTKTGGLFSSSSYCLSHQLVYREQQSSSTPACHLPASGWHPTLWFKFFISADGLFSENFGAELRLSTGCCIYTFPSWDRCESHLALLLARTERSSHSRCTSSADRNTELRSGNVADRRRCLEWWWCRRSYSSLPQTAGVNASASPCPPKAKLSMGLARAVV